MSLYGDLPPNQQDAVLVRGPRRKVVLATNVAETSVTVHGVTGVVDTGLARLLMYNPAVGLDRLRLVPVSRASADQRAGRAGRTAPGVCVRLWSASAHRGRLEQEDPEIRRVDLASAVLHLLAVGEIDVHAFCWLDPPRPAAVTGALDLLDHLGAVTNGRLTDLGRALARLPVHPRLGRLLLEGRRFGCSERAALIAALLSERDPFARRELEQPRSDSRRMATVSDVLERVEALEEFERSGQKSFVCGKLHPAAARFVLRSRDQLLRSLGPRRSREPTSLFSPDEALLRVLLAAFVDRLARRREPGSRRGIMVGGRGVRLAPSSGVRKPELFVCVEVDAGQAETVVHLASGVQRDWLAPEQLRTTIEVLFDEPSECVIARRRTLFGDLVLDERPGPVPPGEEVAQVLASAARRRLQRVLPPEDSPAAAYRTRVRCLRQWMPELQLPDFDDNWMSEMVAALCQGRRSFVELREGPWLEALQGSLTHAQRQAVDREAPERLVVPGGSRLVLRYELGRPPVLAVRIQEMFGLRQTPCVAGDRVRVLLQLLAPNYRPQQVTDDLESFWANTYPQVRKDLRARYPRHAWPEDPWSAVPQQKPGRRKSR
jgi:ATP-dependent helicase HrpB